MVSVAGDLRVFERPDVSDRLFVLSNKPFHFISIYVVPLASATSSPQRRPAGIRHPNNKETTRLAKTAAYLHTKRKSLIMNEWMFYLTVQI